jgi:broad specificity phosphatase PhoE
MRILFARHGESTANVDRVIANRDSDHPLTARGREQAAALAEAVRPFAPQRIISSSIARAVETAAIVGGTLGVPIEADDALREFDCGVMEGRGDDAAWAAHAGVLREWFVLGRPDARIEGGESLTDLRARFIPFVAAAAQDLLAHGSGAILMISHGGLLQSLLPEVLDGLDPAKVREHPMPNTAFAVADIGPNGRLTSRGWPA